jgi:hypothetical protein
MPIVAGRHVGDEDSGELLGPLVDGFVVRELFGRRVMMGEDVFRIEIGCAHPAYLPQVGESVMQVGALVIIILVLVLSHS